MCFTASEGHLAQGVNIALELAATKYIFMTGLEFSRGNVGVPGEQTALLPGSTTHGIYFGLVCIMYKPSPKPRIPGNGRDCCPFRLPKYLVWRFTHYIHTLATNLNLMMTIHFTSLSGGRAERE